MCINTVKKISAGTDNIEKYDKLLETEEAAEKLAKNKIMEIAEGLQVLWWYYC